MPTKTTRRSLRGRCVASASAAAAGSRANEESGFPAGAWRSRARRASSRPRRAASRLARAELARCRRPAGRASCGASSSGSSIAAHRLSAVWREPTSTAAGAREALAGVREEALRVRLDRVLQRRAVDLDGVGHVAERPREDGRAHDQVVGERDVGARPLGDLAHGGDVALQVAVELGLRQVGERLGLDPVVAVGDVDRQQAAEVGAVDRRPHRLAARLELAAPRRPSRPPRRPTPARTARAPGRAGGPRGPRAPAPPRGGRCRRSSRCRRADSRGRSGSARCGTLAGARRAAC